MSGVVCKVWNVSAGSNKNSNNNKSSKGTRAHLTCSVNYVLNEDKTRYEVENLPAFQVTLSTEAKYVARDIKTLNRAYTAVIGCTSLDNAVNEMMDIKNFYGKLEGRNALHGFISLEANESDIRNAGKLMLLTNDVIREVFPGHQAILGVHTDTGNLHCHFLINSVGLNGKKIHQNDTFIRDILHPAVNRAVSRYGFTINKAWEEEKRETKLPIKEQKINARNAINTAIEYSLSFDEFLINLKKQGYTCNVGKHLSIQNADMPKPMRTYQLGKEYSIEGITEKILAKDKEISYSKISEKSEHVEFKKPEYKSSPMKKYKDLSKSEKERVIRLIKRGKNPWQEESARNWQINKQQRAITFESNIASVIRAYSPDHSIDGAMSEIIKRQKELAKERKALKESQKPYKEPMRIYKQMQKLERKAFLYEIEGKEEYRLDYEKYKELYNSLINYGRTPNEMAEYIRECDNEKTYAKAQEKELSRHYKMLKSYKETGSISMERDTIYDKSHHREAMDNARMSFHVSKDIILCGDRKDIFIHVVIAPETVKGKVTSVTRIDITDDKGNILDCASSLDKSFISWTYEMQKSYGIRNIKEYKSFEEARKMHRREPSAEYKNNRSVHSDIRR